MKFFAAIVSLAFVATAYAFPLDLSDSSEVIQNDLKAWRSNFLIGGQKIQLGLGWKNDGTVAVGAKATASINGEDLPISVAVSTNAKEPLKKINYEVGTKVLDKVSAVVYGSNDGDVKYLIAAAAPISEANSAVGVSLEGEKLKPSALTVGVSHDSEVIQAVVGIGDNYIPNSVNVKAGSDRSISL